jgi:pyruvate formate lyase activating enzyme
MRKEARLWEKISDETKKVKCNVCSHYCVISPGKRGICHTRENVDGILYTLIYGSAIHRGSVDPIEKKPLYHFWPGSYAYSIATIGCNFKCKHCQNWEISQAIPDNNGQKAEFSTEDQSRARPFTLTELTPDAVVKLALKTGSKSIAYTYNEPTIWFEFMEDCAKLAKQKGIKNILVTNGYSSPEANQRFIQYIDAANIDIKAFTNEFYKRIVGIPSLQPVLDTAKFFKDNDLHVEITNLIIPNENDNLEDIGKMIDWIGENLGSETPLHFSAYRPEYRLSQPRTPSKILMDAWKLAKNRGMYNVFVGNVLVHEGNNSFCSNCGETLVERQGYCIKNRNLTKTESCKNCEQISSIIGYFE